MATSPGGGVYWTGADGNYYIKTATSNGVQNLGAATPDNPNIDVINGLTQIQDPNPPQQTTPTTTTTNTGTGTSDPNAVAYYDDVIQQLQSQLSAAQNEQPTILGNIENSANQSRNELNQSESTAESGYGTQRATNGQQRAQNIGSIDANSNGTYQALMSLLGMNGAGVSSAARFGAPQAVAKEASGQRAGANFTYNSNDAGITSNENATKQQYQNAVSDLLTQENNSKANALSTLLGQEAQIQQQIGAAEINKAQYGGQTYAQAKAGAGNMTQAIQNTENQLQDIFKQYATPSFAVTPVQASAPNLAKYSVDPTTIKASAANPGTDQSLLPYLGALKNNDTNILAGMFNPQDQKQQQQVGAGAASAPAVAAGAVA